MKSPEILQYCFIFICILRYNSGFFFLFAWKSINITAQNTHELNMQFNTSV